MPTSWVPRLEHSPRQIQRACLQMTENRAAAHAYATQDYLLHYASSSVRGRVGSHWPDARRRTRRQWAEDNVCCLGNNIDEAIGQPLTDARPG